MKKILFVLFIFLVFTACTSEKTENQTSDNIDSPVIEEEEMKKVDELLEEANRKQDSMKKELEKLMSEND